MQLAVKMGLMSVSNVTPVFIEGGGKVAVAGALPVESSAQAAANPSAAVKVIAMYNFMYVPFNWAFRGGKTPDFTKSFKQNRHECMARMTPLAGRKRFATILPRG
jgi:hypothetical protein